MIIIGDQVTTLAAGSRCQHTPVFFEGSRPQSTEDVVLTPATGGGKAASPATTTAH